MQRISVVGPSGSGKTTVTAGLSASLGCSALEIDSVYWQADWTPIDVYQLRHLGGRVAGGDSWVIDGNSLECQ